MNKKIVISTHQMVYGASHALKEYLINKKIDNLLFIGLPLLFNRQYSRLFYLKGKLKEKTEFNKKIKLGLLDNIIEFILVIFWTLTVKGKQDVFIGVDCFNCYAGLVLKKIGKVKKIILFTIDFTPRRFKNSLLNAIYHYIEKICVYNADEVWDVSPRIAGGRNFFLGIPQNMYKRKIVPVGIWGDRVKKRNFSDVKKHQLLFMGTLYEKQGIQLVLDVVPELIKQIPDFKFLILGGGEYEEFLKQQVKNLKIEKYVEFRGWITDRKIIDELMSESACAVATYKPEKNKLSNFSYYADPTKIKDYISAGVPIIITDVSYNAKEIAKRKCGILVDYEKDEVYKAVFLLMKNEKILNEYRNNCLNYSKKFAWNNIFHVAFKNL